VKKRWSKMVLSLQHRKEKVVVAGKCRLFASSLFDICVVALRVNHGHRPILKNDDDEIQ
jgi:hypothetical protein